MNIRAEIAWRDSGENYLIDVGQDVKRLTLTDHNKDHKQRITVQKRSRESPVCDVFISELRIVEPAKLGGKLVAHRCFKLKPLGTVEPGNPYKQTIAAEDKREYDLTLTYNDTARPFSSLVDVVNESDGVQA